MRRFKIEYIYLLMKFLSKIPHIHIYINGHYNPSVRIIDLVSHTTYVVNVNFLHEWRDLNFKVDSEQQIFWETFHGNFIYSEFLPDICWEEIAEEMLFVFHFDVWPGTRTLTSRPRQLQILNPVQQDENLIFTVQERNIYIRINLI